VNGWQAKLRPASHPIQTVGSLACREWREIPIALQPGSCRNCLGKRTSSFRCWIITVWSRSCGTNPRSGRGSPAVVFDAVIEQPGGYPLLMARAAQGSRALTSARVHRYPRPSTPRDPSRHERDGDCCRAIPVRTTLFRRRSCEKVAPAGQFETGDGVSVTCRP